LEQLTVQRQQGFHMLLDEMRRRLGNRTGIIKIKIKLLEIDIFFFFIINI
jgi:hypothetical protein